MIELYNALKIITLLFFIQTFNLGVAFLKSVSILYAIQLHSSKHKIDTSSAHYVSLQLDQTTIVH